jgi:hypothetical protein
MTLRQLVLSGLKEAESAGRVITLSQWYEEIIEISARLPSRQVSLSTARRLAGRLRSNGYVDTEKLDGKRERVLLTAKGRRAAELIRGKWRRLISLKPVSAEPVSDQQQEDEPADDGPPLVPPVPGDLDQLPAERSIAATVSIRRRRRQPSPERVRRRRISHQRLHEQMNGSFRLSFRGNTIRYIQVLSPVEEWSRGPVWEQLLTGYDQDGLPLYTTLGVVDDDPIASLLPDAWRPRDRCFAAAVELKQDKDGFQVAEWVDENNQPHPRVGVLVQSARNFFQPLLRAEPSGRILRVKGSGTGKKRTYEFTGAGVALPLNVEFDLDAFLDELFAEDRIEQLSELPPGWFQMPPKRQQLVQWLLQTAA